LLFCGYDIAVSAISFSNKMIHRVKTEAISKNKCRKGRSLSSAVCWQMCSDCNYYC